jgi:transmembrane 9 superfamily protein 3
MLRTFQVFLALSVLFFCAARCAEETHRYEPREPVSVWANKIGPFDNPHETYQFYTLPFCRPEQMVEHAPDGLGEVLEGNRLIRSLIEINFLETVEHKRYCEIPMDERRAVIFAEAVRQNYWYQFIVDDLPMWAMLGARFQAAPEDAADAAAAAGKTAAAAAAASEPRPYIYTHKRFDFAVNGDRFIEANLTSGDPVPITPGQAIVLTYSAYWHATDHAFAYRYSRYLDFNFFEHQVHWFSIVNSFMMVMFLVGLVAMILMRTLRNDFAKYALSEDLAEMVRVWFFFFLYFFFFFFFGAQKKKRKKKMLGLGFFLFLFFFFSPSLLRFFFSFLFFFCHICTGYT